MIRVQVEPWSEALRDLLPLFPLHWEELGLDRDVIPMDMDTPRYEALDALGQIHLTTARDGERLVGYVICFVIRHLHYRSAGEMALADMYWLDPAHRRGTTAIRLFTEMERSLRERGVVRMHMSCKVHQDHTALFEWLGYTLSDFTFSKLLKERRA